MIPAEATDAHYPTRRHKEPNMLGWRQKVHDRMGVKLDTLSRLLPLLQV